MPCPPGGIPFNQPDSFPFSSSSAVSASSVFASLNSSNITLQANREIIWEGDIGQANIIQREGYCHWYAGSYILFQRNFQINVGDGTFNVIVNAVGATDPLINRDVASIETYIKGKITVGSGGTFTMGAATGVLNPAPGTVQGIRNKALGAVFNVAQWREIVSGPPERNPIQLRAAGKEGGPGGGPGSAVDMPRTPP